MNKEKEIQIAWTIWHLMARLGILLWNQYEKQFVERYIKIKEEKYCGNQSDKDFL
jgi:hypothetical protein